MISGNKVAVVNDLKNYVRSWQREELVFSYNLRFSVTPSGPKLTLHQNQTDFSLSLIIQPSPDSLSISSFTLDENNHLGDLCQPLYDASLIEIVLQGLILTVFCAQRFNKADVTFTIPSEEEAHLTSLSHLFNSTSSHTTVEGKRQVLTMFVWPPHFDKFFDSLEDMKIQLRQQLWTYQKTDAFLRRYLQRPDRLENTLLSTFVAPKKEEPKTLLENVIAFPLPSHHRSAI